MRALSAVFAVCLAACSGGDEVDVAGVGALALRAETALPPGQSGFFSLAGQAAGLASGDPAAYGEHVDDQRRLHWWFGAKPAALGTKPGTALRPKDGVETYRGPPAADHGRAIGEPFAEARPPLAA